MRAALLDVGDSAGVPRQAELRSRSRLPPSLTLASRLCRRTTAFPVRRHAVAVLVHNMDKLHMLKPYYLSPSATEALTLACQSHVCMSGVADGNVCLASSTIRGAAVSDNLRTFFGDNVRKARTNLNLRHACHSAPMWHPQDDR